MKLSEKKKELRITEVSYEEFTDYQFIPMSTFYIMSATQTYYFIHTSKRAEAQAWADENFGKGMYTVKASKLQKTKSKREDGGLSCTGTETRKR